MSNTGSRGGLKEKTSCNVCHAKPHLYKCPKCLIKYCSVSCYKVHQTEICHTSKKEINSCNSDGSISGLASQRPSQSHLCNTDAVGAALKCSNVQSAFLDDLEQCDRVPTDILNKLDASKVLDDMLSNPHLVAMIKSLDSSRHPDADISRAMHEPIFIEFATECLNVVQPLNSI